MAAARSNPPSVVCDSDALIQIFLSCGVQVLRWLRSRYGVQPIVSPEVELELRSHRRHGPQIDADLRKAIANGALVVADRAYVDLLATPPAAADALYRQIQATGVKYALRVGKGEAYTHAWAIGLGVPALSNDEQAVRTLLGQSLVTAAPVVRFYDLVILGLQADFFTKGACDSIRSDLRNKDEGVVREFDAQSLDEGLKTFVPRLIDSTYPLVGNSGSPGQTGHETRLTLIAI